MAKAKDRGLVEKQTSLILNSITDGVFTVDREWRITSFNRAAAHITGISEQTALGQRCSEIFHASICEKECPLQEAMHSNRPIVNKLVDINNSRGDKIPISISCSVLKDETGLMLGGVEIFRDLSQVEEWRKRAERAYCYEDIISCNHRMRELFDILPALACSDSTVLIEGASGTGKELFARALHHLSRRAAKPFVAVNCGTLPDTLLESELFGYKSGAFTDARRDKLGRFALAEGGTLLLDEISDISPALQVRLLRVLQDHSYELLGGTESVVADVRIIAATNRDLIELMHQGLFRMDLYYRINVVELKLPLLRDRRDDIPLLVEHFITRFNKMKNKNIIGVSQDAMMLLMRHDYPGNVRELENAIEHAFVLCNSGLIEIEHLPEHFADGRRDAKSDQMTVKAMERSMIVDALKRNGGNRKKAAAELGFHKSTFFRKIKAHAIKLPHRDGRNQLQTLEVHS